MRGSSCGEYIVYTEIMRLEGDRDSMRMSFRFLASLSLYLDRIVLYFELDGWGFWFGIRM